MTLARCVLVSSMVLLVFGPVTPIRAAEKGDEAKGTGWTTTQFVETAAKGLVGLIGVIYTMAQIRASLPRSRTNLKADLEILALVPTGDSNRKVIEASIQRQINALYVASRQSRFTIHSPEDFIIGVLCLVGFGVWTAILIAGQHYYGAFFTGFFALAGLGGIMNGFDPKKQKTPKAPKKEP